MKKEFTKLQRHHLFTGILFIIIAVFPYNAKAYNSSSVGPSPQLFHSDGTHSLLKNWNRMVYGSSVFTGDLLGDGSMFIGFTEYSDASIKLLKQDGETWVDIASSGTNVEPFSILDGIEAIGVGTVGATANFSGTAKRDIILGSRRDAISEEIRFDGKKRKVVASAVVWFRYATDIGFTRMKSFFPFGTTYSGGVNVAAGDVTGDGIDEIIVAKSAGNRPDVAIFSNDGTLLSTLSVYESNFRGGVNVGSVDYNGDGRDDLVVAPQSKRAATIQVFDIASGQVLQSFTVFPGLQSGLSFSIHESTKRLLVGTPAGFTPRIQEYDLHTATLVGLNILPYQQAFQGGTEVAYLQNVSGDFIVTHGAKYLTGNELVSYDWWFDSAPKGALRRDGTPVPSLFGADGSVLAQYPAVPPGASISVNDVDNDGVDEIAFGSPPGQPPRVWLYQSNGALIKSFTVFDKQLRTGVTVALLPQVAERSAIVLVTPRNGAQSFIRHYTLDGTYTGISFRVHASTFTKGIMMVVGHFQDKNEYQILTMPRGASLPMKLFSSSGKLIRQRSVALSQQTKVPYDSSVAVLPDSDGDGFDDIIHFAGPTMTSVFFTSFSGINLQTIWDYTRAEEWGAKYGPNGWTFFDPPFISFLRGDSAAQNYGPITVRSIDGRTKLAYGSAGNIGPVVIVTGPSEFDRNIINTFPNTWKGSVTPASLLHGFLGKEAYVVVPGRPMDSATWNRDLNFLRPSDVPTGQISVAKSMSGKLPHGSYTVKIVIANLKSKKLQVRAVMPTCKGKCAAPMTSYIKSVHAFSGINATGPYPYELRQNPYDPKTVGKLLGFHQDSTGVITFTNTNEWFVSRADTLLRDNYYGIRTNFFTTRTGQRPIAGWGLSSTPGRSPGSLIGVRGGDLYFITYYVRGGGIAEQELINSFNFVYIGANDGGGAIALYHRGKFLSGPGRNIDGALLLTEK